MPAGPLGCRFHHNIRSPFDWPEQVTGSSEGVIHDKREVVLFGHLPEFLEIRNVQPRFSYSFQITGFGVLTNMFYKAFDTVAIGKSHVNAQVLECYFEMIVG